MLYEEQVSPRKVGLGRKWWDETAPHFSESTIWVLWQSSFLKVLKGSTKIIVLPDSHGIDKQQIPSTSQHLLIENLKNHRLHCFAIATPAKGYCHLCVDDDEKMTSQRSLVWFLSISSVKKTQVPNHFWIHLTPKIRYLRNSKQLHVTWVSPLHGLLWDLIRALSRVEYSFSKMLCHF